MARSAREIAIEVHAASIRRGDVINVGGRAMTVVNLINLPRGGKRIEFDGGAVLSVRAGESLTAFRIAEGW